MKKQVGKVAVIETVGELKHFIADLDDKIKLDIGWDEPVEILVMKDSRTKKLTLCMRET